MAKKKGIALATWQIEDAKRLKQAFAASQQRGKLASQSAFGAEANMTQGAIWQYMNARRPLNLRNVIAFSNILDVMPEDISPTLAKELAKTPQDPTHIQPGAAMAAVAIDRGLPIEVISAAIEGARSVQADRGNPIQRRPSLKKGGPRQGG